MRRAIRRSARSMISPSRMNPRSEYSICVPGSCTSGSAITRARTASWPLASLKKSRCAGSPESCSSSMRTVTRARHAGSGSDFAAAANSGKIALRRAHRDRVAACLHEHHRSRRGDDRLRERCHVVDRVRQSRSCLRRRASSLPNGCTASSLFQPTASTPPGKAPSATARSSTS